MLEDISISWVDFIPKTGQHPLVDGYVANSSDWVVC